MNTIRFMWKEHILTGNRNGNRELGTSSLFLICNTSPMFQNCKSGIRKQVIVPFKLFRVLTVFFLSISSCMVCKDTSELTLFACR